MKLEFSLEEWQSETILRVLEGYDSIFVAGTGYGKSVIFEGLAAMSPKKTFVVVCPLKTLEKDQVSFCEASWLLSGVADMHSLLLLGRSC